MYGIESLLAGRTLVDRYRIEEVIGRGGMGAVYRAMDERLGREVAVKVIAVAAPGPEAHARLRARFHREARAAAGLRHPNVVSVYDFGTDTALDLDFLVMELLRGEDLSTRLARAGPPPFPATLKILWQAARGLAAGHRAGLIHRDIKPGNLYLEEDDHPDDVQLRVLDFGIAEIITDEETLTHLTAFGRSPFSPAYASPEQLRGESRLTPATDVFSLGAVGFHLATGHRAFTSSDPERMAAELSASLASLRSRAPLLSFSARAALERALEHDPRDRFPDAGAFARALEPALQAQASDVAQPDAVRWAEPKDRERETKTGTRMLERVIRRDHAQGTATHAMDELPRAQPAATRASDRRSGFMRQVWSAVWNFFLTTAVIGLLVGSWGVSGWGLWVGDDEAMYGGVAASIVLAPLAVHRVRGQRGSFRLALAGSILASVAAFFLVGPDGEAHHLLGAIFGLQLVASLVIDRLTHRKDPPTKSDSKHSPIRI